MRRALLVLLVLSGPSFVCSDTLAGSKPLRTGMSKTFFTDKSKGIIATVGDDFKNVLKETTGLDGELFSRDSAFEVAEKLHDNKLDIGIFHAFEFAWVQKKYPDLQPLMIAVGKLPEERAYLIVGKNSTAKTLADLSGKTLDMPKETKEHCRLYLQKACFDLAQKAPTAFFSSIKRSESQEEALNEVARGNVQTAIVDSYGLKLYMDNRGPVFEKHLKVLQESTDFPSAVIVHKPGTLDKQTLAKFTTGLQNAHNTRVGQDMMKLWRLRAFEQVPKDYVSGLANLLKQYPAPGTP